MEDEDFLAAVEADNANAPAEEPKPEPETPAEPEAPKPEPEAPAPAEPAPEPAPEAQTPPPPPEPTVAPITALLDEREKRQRAEAELAQFRAAQQQQQVEIPDRDLDPDAYEAYQEASIQNALLNQSLNMSERFARKEHGAETVEAAQKWALQRYAVDPLYQQQVLRDPDPYERVVTDFKRDQLFSKITDPSDYDAFLAWKTAQAGVQQQQGGQPPPPNPTPQIPPRSLASAPSAGDISAGVIQSDAEMFEEVIPKG